MNTNARITLSMNRDWSFCLGDAGMEHGLSHNDIYSGSKAGAVKGVPQSDFNANSWQKVDLPHDWSVKLPFDRSGSPSWGYKPKGKAWYRKAFFLPKEYEGKELLLTFEGVAKDAYVYFNGSLLARNFTAYAPSASTFPTELSSTKDPTLSQSLSMPTALRAGGTRVRGYTVT